MKKEEIKKLIERFMQGDTNCDEERMLAEYFSSEDIDSEFSDYALLFSVLNSTELNFTEPEKEEIINRAVENHLKRNNHIRLWLSSAAMLLAVIGFAYLFNFNQEQTTVAVTTHESVVDSTIQCVDVVEDNLDVAAVIETSRKSVVKKKTTVSKNIIDKTIVDTLSMPMEVFEPILLTEVEIPITHPERLEYTQEEIEQLKRKEREAYQNWVKLQIELIEATHKNTADIK